MPNKNSKLKKLLLFLLLLPAFPVHAQEIPLEVRIGGAAGAVGDFVVQDLGQYLSILYNYLIGIAGVLATVMIMVGGVRWLLAAGDPGKIGAAKETIGSAVIGLALALGSFLILNTINPQLVELRLPYIPKVVQENFFFANRCSDPKYPDGEHFLRARATPRPGESPAPLARSPATSVYPTLKSETTCGYEYYYQSGGGSFTCQGDVCPVGQACGFSVSESAFKCKPRVIGGTISFEDERYLDPAGHGAGLELWVLCNDHATHKVAETEGDAPDLTRKKQLYDITFSKDDLESKIGGSVLGCGGEGNVRGFYLKSSNINEDPSVLQILLSGGEGLSAGGAAAGCVAGLPFGAPGCVLGATIGAFVQNDDTYYMGKGACTQNGGHEPFLYIKNTDVPEGEEGHFIVKPERDIPDDIKDFFEQLEPPSAALWSIEAMHSAVDPANPQPIPCDIEMNYSRYPAQ